MITNFFIPELNNHDVQELWFQRDGATCHTASATIDLLKDTFGDRLISRFGPVNWPPRSCDSPPLDFSVGLCKEDDLRRTMFSSIDRGTAEIRERFQQLQNLAQKYVFLRPEVMLSLD
ncbi:putative transposable element [Trichonephila clavipes]|nr:putative transposable element [Trichonephila clavipes]